MFNRTLNITDLRLSSLQCGLPSPSESGFTPESCRSLLLRSSSIRLEELELRTEARASQHLQDRWQPFSLVNINTYFIFKRMTDSEKSSDYQLFFRTQLRSFRHKHCKNFLRPDLSSLPITCFPVHQTTENQNKILKDAYNEYILCVELLLYKLCSNN